MRAGTERRIEAASQPFREEAATVRQLLADAAAREAPQTEVRALMAVLGGVLRRWRQQLAKVITEDAFDGLPTSREKVRQWQREAFGRAVSSNELHRYAITARAGGGRSGFVEPPAETTERARALFKARRSF